LTPAHREFIGRVLRHLPAPLCPLPPLSRGCAVQGAHAHARRAFRRICTAQFAFDRGRWGGTGDPRGLAGEEIRPPGRVCAVCDVFDALLSDRPCKEPLPYEGALTDLRRERRHHFDAAVVDAFLRIVGDLDPKLLASAATPVRPR
jgi:HD domain